MLDDLKNPSEAAAYLDACTEDDDPAVFLLTLRQVVKARGMTALAHKAHVGSESLYKTLSESGNPELRTINKLLHDMNMRLSVTAS